VCSLRPGLGPSSASASSSSSSSKSKSKSKSSPPPPPAIFPILHAGDPFSTPVTARYDAATGKAADANQGGLPTDCLTRVLGFFGDPKTAATVSGVSRRWHRIMEKSHVGFDFWRQLYLDKFAVKISSSSDDDDDGDRFVHKGCNELKSTGEVSVTVATVTKRGKEEQKEVIDAPTVSPQLVALERQTWRRRGGAQTLGQTANWRRLYVERTRAERAIKGKTNSKQYRKKPWTLCDILGCNQICRTPQYREMHLRDHSKQAFLLSKAAGGKKPKVQSAICGVCHTSLHEIRELEHFRDMKAKSKAREKTRKKELKNKKKPNPQPEPEQEVPAAAAAAVVAQVPAEVAVAAVAAAVAVPVPVPGGDNAVYVAADGNAAAIAAAAGN
jgi:hypothetical protein